MRILIAIMALLALTGCDRSRELPDCRDVQSPKDYGKFLVNPTTGLAQHVSGTIWYRCMAGQSFRGKKCLGEPLELSLSEAKSYLRDFHESLEKSGDSQQKMNLRKFSRPPATAHRLTQMCFPELPSKTFG